MAAPAKTKEMQRFAALMTAYEREVKKWEVRAEKIIKKYRGDDRTTEQAQGEVRFNILWSNVQTLVPATFSRLPKADVSRRYRDQDPVGRVASLLLERALEYEIAHYSDFRTTMKADVFDRFLGGRGTAWARYEPHMRAAKEQLPQDGAEITEDVDKPNEQLDYECAPTDYVHWRDFGHNVARTWEEVSTVWRRVYMHMPAKIERFGKAAAEKIPKDARPSDDRYPKQMKDGDDGEDNGSWIVELWDKDAMRVYWFHKAMRDTLDERDDPLGLDGFFPCPKPLYATLTNESLIPIPDFILYQDQARSLDTLADRIYGLIDMLQVKGVYDGGQKEVGRLFTEGRNGTLIPVKNWAAFAEKNGLQGALDIVDLDPIARALKEAYAAFAQVIQFIYQITGIADIVRGVTDPNETLGAQEIKKNFVGLRLGDMKMAVAQFATELLQLKAQIMCSQFDPQTILTIAAADQLSPEDQALIPQAMELLVGPERMANPDAPPGPNPMRSFRIEVAENSLIQIDEQEEKENRMQLLTTFGGYLDKAAPLVAQAPQTAPLVVEIGKFVLQSFKVGKGIEGTFDQLLDQLKQVAAQPMPDPKMMEEQITAKVKQDNAQKEIGLNAKASDLDIREAKFNAEQQIAKVVEEAKNAKMDFERQMMAKDAEMMKRDDAMKMHDDTMGMEKMRLRAETLQKGIKGIDPETLAVVPPDQDPEVLLMKELVQGTQAGQQALAQAIQMLVQVVERMDATLQATMLPRENELVRDPVSGRAMKSISRVVTN